jgi:hypothetical protein
MIFHSAWLYLRVLHHAACPTLFPRHRMRWALASVGVRSDSHRVRHSGHHRTNVGGLPQGAAPSKGYLQVALWNW